MKVARPSQGTARSSACSVHSALKLGLCLEATTLHTTNSPHSSIARALPAPTALTPPETYLPRLLRPLRSHPRARLLARLTPNHLVPHSSLQATRPVEAAQATRSSSGARLRRLVIIPTIILDDRAAGAAAHAPHAACAPAFCLCSLATYTRTTLHETAFAFLPYANSLLETDRLAKQAAHPPPSRPRTARHRLPLAALDP